ncbi:MULTISPECIES: hypothetical protein [unclassified Erwinia]|uniref:hypothetical protein n=1 Tax=unclassified Erwinia TaxID=2622719 RepID=UPI0030AFA493
MSVFRKEVLERKKNNINGVILDDSGKKQMKVMLVLMVVICVPLLFLSQHIIRKNTVVGNIALSTPIDGNEGCFDLQQSSARNINISPDEFIVVYLNGNKVLTGKVVSVKSKKEICIKINNKYIDNPSSLQGRMTAFLWEDEKLWLFLYNKFKGSTGI